jgi:DNA replication and repair protein RecF
MPSADGYVKMVQLMHITHISLTNFRNYGRLEMDLPAGPTLLHGANAQGKTNLLEAIYYLATTRSPHADTDQQLINWDALRPEELVIVGRLVVNLSTENGPKQIELRLIKEQQQGQSTFRREALVDRRKVRLMDLLGNLRVTLFLPQDIQLVTGSPSKRRRYLDITLCQTDPEYCRTLSAYNKVLEQRNALLRRIVEQGVGHDVLPVYTEKLIQLGSKVFARRASFVSAIARDLQRIYYEELTEGHETLRLSYLPRVSNLSSLRNDPKSVQEAIDTGLWLADQDDAPIVAERFQQALTEVQAAELASGTTRLGPHRDDWRFWVDGRDLSSFGSRGQQRSAILALKLAEITWMGNQTGDTPVLLLDEVVAELDQVRRKLLLETVCNAHQAVLTATDPGMFTSDFLKQATSMTVAGGRVSHDLSEPVTS